MRILVGVYYYTPDGGPSAPLFTMLCQELARRGHSVTALACVPHYPSGRVPEKYRGRLIQRSREDGVDVVRIRVPSLERSSMPRRMLQFVTYQLGATVSESGQDFDVALFSNPALLNWLPFAFLSAVRRKPIVFSVHDVYPDVGVALGIFRHRPVVSAVSALERFCLDRAVSVRILSESFVPPMRRLGVPDHKIALIYDWVDTDLIRPLPRDNAFSRECDLTGRFTVLYAGNIGLSQGLECVLDSAERLAAHDDIRFVFVGDGAGRAGLVREAERRKLGNVKFFEFQPRPRLPEVLATGDVSLVILRKGIGVASLPSKTLSALASGRPILASVDETSDTCALVRRADAGLCVPPEDSAALAEAVLELRNDVALRARLGRNGRDYALQHHSLTAAADRFERLLSDAAKGNGR